MKHLISLTKEGKPNISDENPEILAWFLANQDKFRVLNDHLDYAVVVGEWNGTTFIAEGIEGLDPIHAFCYLEDADLV